MKFVLAPLAGFTDAPFRRLCFEGGADLCFTEMVSAAGLAHGSSPTRHLMETLPGEGPVAVQIFGSEEKDVAFAAAAVTEVAGASSARIVELNLNAGCPVPKVVRAGAGARLMNDPGKIGRLLRAMVENTHLPVTLKTRLGPRPGDNRIFEMLDAAESAGATGISIHARYASQMHGGPVGLDTLSEVVRRSHIPVTGNGSVTDAASAAAMAATGVAAIMVGRAALAKPDVFRMLKEGRGAAPTADPRAVAERHLAGILEFRELLAVHFPGDRIPSPDAFASVKMHTHLFRYFAGHPGASALRARLGSIRTLDGVRECLASFVHASPPVLV